MPELNKTRDSESNELKLGTVIDVEALSAPASCLAGECLVHGEVPEVTPAEARVLPAVKTRQITPGQAFAVLESTDGAAYEVRGYTALAEVTLTGPLIWTEIAAPQGVSERLKDITYKRDTPGMVLLLGVPLGVLFVAFFAFGGMMFSLGLVAILVLLAAAYGLGCTLWVLLDWALSLSVKAAQDNIDKKIVSAAEFSVPKQILALPEEAG